MIAYFTRHPTAANLLMIVLLFLGAVFLMPMLGLSVNMFTLLGMLLALGILMDDGIVIAENVAAHRARGTTAIQAAIDGVSEVSAGVFSSFITAVCVLGPLAFISGRIGEVLGVIPVMLVVVLSISLIEAFFILPAHLGHALDHADVSKPNRWRQRADLAFESIREEVFGRLVDFAVRYRYLTLGPAGRPIELCLKGTDLMQLKLASAGTLAWFAQFKGVRNLSDDLRQGKPEVQFRLATGATALGLTTSSVAEQVRAGFQGVDIGEVQFGNETRVINVGLELSDRDGLSDLDGFPISVADGNLVPLATVADHQLTRGWSRISRADRSRAVTVFGDVDARITSGSALVSRFRNEQADAVRDRFPGVQFDFGGETKESRTTVVSLLTGAAIGLVGVFVLLSFQFRSYSEPLVVMAAIPLALIGVLWGHVIVGIDMTMPSALGFASLAGIVVNDAILLVLFLKEHHLQHQDVIAAATSASRERFRAIVLTSLTTVAGLLPLIFETSLQAQVLIPMAVSIAFGIMSSTVLVLLVVPSLYAVLNDFRLVSEEVVVSR